MKDTILIVTPFRNEGHSILQYLTSLRRVDYPKKLIDLYWLENDSSDQTLSILKTAKNLMQFKSTTLKSVNILGPLKKREIGSYYKDIGHVQNRRNAWKVIWNKYFLPLIRSTNHKYVLFWYADSVPPKNIITEYLKVFTQYPNVGWVGGKMYRRFPRQNEIISPLPLGFTRPRKKDHIDTMEIANDKIEQPTRAELTMHVFMIPRKPLCKCTFYYTPVDMHFSIANGLDEQGLKVYYQPTVYIRHVSTDGKIWEPK